MIRLDTNQIEQLQELMAENFGTLIETYIMDNEKRVQELATKIEERTWDKVKTIAHTMKSSSANIGALELSDICHQLESDAVNNVENIAEKYGRLLSEFKAVKTLLHEYLLRQ